MVRSLSIIAILISFTLNQGYAQGIQFEKGNWMDVVEKAKKEKKGIFVDVYTSWCGPCKWMSANVFTDEKVGKYLNENFINYKIDAEKGDGPSFAKEYNVKGYPTLLFFDQNGQAVHKFFGSTGAENFFKLANDAQDPSKQFYTLQKKYINGERNPDFLYNYILALAEVKDPYKKVEEEYYATQSNTELISSKNFDLMVKTLKDYQSRPFLLVLKKKKKFEKLEGKDKINTFITKVYNAAIYSVSRSQDDSKMKALKAELNKRAPKFANEMIALLNYKYNLESKDKHKYAKIYFDQYCKSFYELNNEAWEYYNNETDPKKLEDALNWATKSVEIQKEYFNMDTKACLLFKLKKYEEVIDVAKETIQLGTKVGRDTKEAKAILEEATRALESN